MVVPKRRLQATQAPGPLAHELSTVFRQQTAVYKFGPDLLLHAPVRMRHDVTSYLGRLLKSPKPLHNLMTTGHVAAEIVWLAVCFARFARGRPQKQTTFEGVRCASHEASCKHSTCKQSLTATLRALVQTRPVANPNDYGPTRTSPWHYPHRNPRPTFWVTSSPEPKAPSNDTTRNGTSRRTQP